MKYRIDVIPKFSIGDKVSFIKHSVTIMSFIESIILTSDGLEYRLSDNDYRITDERGRIHEDNLAPVNRSLRDDVVIIEPKYTVSDIVYITNDTDQAPCKVLGIVICRSVYKYLISNSVSEVLLVEEFNLSAEKTVIL